MADKSTADTSTTAGFECAVLDADEAPLFIKRHAGIIVYVRILSGTLPNPLHNILIDPYDRLIGRPAGAFQPTPAQLTVPAGRTYPVNVLASLPPLDKMRPYLRAGLRPPAHLDPAAVPVALEGLRDGFRALAGSLTPVQPDATAAPFNPRMSPRERRQFQLEDSFSAQTIRQQVAQLEPNAASELLVEALTDERQQVRDTAAHALIPFAASLPLAPFLVAIEDKRTINYASCLAAAYVFAAHPVEVPIEALLDLYHNMSPGKWSSPPVQIVMIAAMGRLGERATAEVINLLADIVQEPRAIHDIRVRRQAAIELARFGERAPVEALIAGLDHNTQPEVVAAIARTLAQHPAQIPEEVRERARLLSDDNVARQIIYGRLGFYRNK